MQRVDATELKSDTTPDRPTDLLKTRRSNVQRVFPVGYRSRIAAMSEVGHT